MMWSAFASLLLAAFTASTLASPSPLSTSSNTVTTLSGLGPGNANGGILIHVLRTEDLIADKVPTKPLLLERLSHLLIRIELGKQTVAVNGHHLPILPGSHRPLEMSVKLKQVQMLKMPNDSPLVPLRLSAPEVANIADKYMSEGIVAAMFRVTQEPLVVEAMRDDNTPIQAEAFKVTFGIKILEVDGLSLAETDLPPVDLLHLIVHPDPSDPSKVGTLTTLAPEALTAPTPNFSPFGKPSSIGSALDITRESLLSTFETLRNALQGMAAHTRAFLGASRPRKPCHRRPAHHYNHAAPHHHHEHAAKPAKPIEMAAATTVTPQDTPVTSTGRTSAVDSFRRKMKCITKMVAHSSFVLLLLGLPLALVFMAFVTALSTLVRRRMQSSSSQDVPPTYQALAVHEKLSDEEVVLLMTSVEAEKA